MHRELLLGIVISWILIILGAIQFVKNKGIKEQLKQIVIPTKEKEYYFIVSHKRKKEILLLIGVVIFCIFMMRNRFSLVLVIIIIIKLIYEMKKFNLKITFIGNKIIVEKNKSKNEFNIAQIEKIIFKIPKNDQWFFSRKYSFAFFEKKRYPHMWIVLKENKILEGIRLDKENYLIIKKYCSINHIKEEDEFEREVTFL